jgi:hypothetical protein
MVLEEEEPRLLQGCCLGNFWGRERATQAPLLAAGAPGSGAAAGRALAARPCVTATELNKALFSKMHSQVCYSVSSVAS